jgi:hypothetical protein
VWRHNGALDLSRCLTLIVMGLWFLFFGVLDEFILLGIRFSRIFFFCMWMHVNSLDPLSQLVD